MPITKRDLERSKEFLDEDAKIAFLEMSREDQMVILLSMEGSNSNRLAVVEKRQIDSERDVRLYREKRERRENNDDDDMSMTQKIVKMIEEERAKQFNFLLWFRDRVLPQVITLITLAILYLTFGGKLP